MGEEAVADPAAPVGAAAARTLGSTASNDAASALIGRRAAGERFQRRELGRIDAERCERRDLGREGSARRELVADRVGHDRDRRGIVAGGGLFRRDTGFDLRRGERALDLFDPAGERREIGGDG